MHLTDAMNTAAVTTTPATTITELKTNGIISHSRKNNNSITTTASSTSSTDSGVILIDNSDNTRTINGNSEYNNSNNNNYCNDNNEMQDNGANNTTEEEQQQQQLNITKSKVDNNQQNFNLNIENINNTNAAQQQEEHKSANDRRQKQQPTTMLSTKTTTTTTAATTTTKNGSRKCSPTVSIRSTTISIVSIDENAIDSSVIDSDSDLEADEEGVHGSYVVKKLGQQTTYAPNSPEIPNINKGLTVLSQTISPHIAGVENMLSTTNGITSPAAQPQIGSIALTNSSDVTFGDKHFYEGPVTIQQFLIDNREKLKKSNEFVDGQDNPLYADEQYQTANGGFSGKTPATHQQQQPFKFIYDRRAIFIVAIILMLVILIGVTVAVVTLKANTSTTTSKLLGDGDDSRKNIPINSTIGDANVGPEEDVCPKGQFCVVSRKEWSARQSKEDVSRLSLPVQRIIIAHTASAYCLTQAECIQRVQVIQNFHMDSFQWSDIAYNFLVGGDGRVYVGRGWYIMGSHTKGYNNNSFCIAFIGTFTVSEPTEAQLNAAKMVIEEAVLQQKIIPDYRLYGARQLSSTESPGEALYNIIKKWAHWTNRDNVGAGLVLRIVVRDAWLAQPPSADLVSLNLPVPNVIVLPTQTEDCTTQAACTYRVRFIQTYNIESLHNDDIIYNFLIGGDGNVYEGRGWRYEGAHLKGYNDDSISFAYIGTFKSQRPTVKQLNVTKLLLEEGQRVGALVANYKLLSAHSLDPTLVATSGNALYDCFKDWPHWTTSV